MGKIVKYCAACEEGFAEKFAFCPNCGGALTAYELNPVMEKAASINQSEPVNLKAETPAPAPVVAAQAAPAENVPVEPETVAFSTDKEEKILDDEYLPEETAAFTKAASNGNGFHADDLNSNGNGLHAADDLNEDQYRTNFQSGDGRQTDDASGYHITVIEEKNSNVRNALLLGACVFVITLTLAGVVYSLFTKELYAAGLSNTDLVNAMVVEDLPEEVKEEPKKNKEKGGGGGGGGKEEDEDVSKGTPPRQTQVQLNPPTSKVPQFNAELKYDMSTVGNRDIKRTEQPIGSELGQSAKLSDGRGSGGGMGSGTGTGFGGGRGTGNGNGIGSGNGNGNGNGDGDGDGDGSGGYTPPAFKKPEPKPVGPTEGVKIISKPRANYTDAARTNNIQGVVRVKVTFLANGTIGGISPVSNLGYGLTEQALAAARGIRFEPAKKGGVPYSVTKVVEYTFTLY
ncbi:MAG TPA: energy transducer TonB [Pyrinomonadaceae bacterium]|jgi:TonB family protein